MAYRQVAEFGMSPVIGHISLPKNKVSGGKRMYSQKLSQMIDEVSTSVLLICTMYVCMYVPHA